MDLNTTKYLGGIGALLMFISILPYIGTYSFGVLGLVGLIMVMIAAKGLADYYSEGGIFNNALYGVVVAIVGAVAFAGVLFFALVGFFSDIGINLGLATFTDWSALTSAELQDAIIGSQALTWIGYIFLALVVLFIFGVISAILFRKSMSLTSKKSGVGLFGTSGTVLLVGAVLTIIGVGVILMWIALLLIAIAFFQLREQPAQQAYQATYQTSPPPPPMQM